MVRSLAPKDAQALIASGNVDIVDVRETWEWSNGHIAGARLVPLEALRADPKHALPQDSVLFVCAKGVRSIAAAKLAERLGLRHVYSLEGGTTGWARAGLPLTKDEQAAATPPVAEPSHPQPKSAPPSAEIPLGGPDVASNVRRLRGEQGLSLEQLSRASGLTQPMLEKIENGEIVPSIGVVWKIARALAVPFSALLTTQDRAGNKVLRRKEARRLTSVDGKFASRALFPWNEPRRVEFYELWLAPRGVEQAEPHQAGTRENLVVTSGQLDLTVGGETFHLDTGDAILFDATVAHTYANPADAECVMHLVMTYAGEVG